ncbi:hypothetical protein FA13DRAFT_1682447 [Coprinellus micaceus]|uniref:Translation initiation factor eIF2B subunit gamma n=1 Tax=Coprinellus micaceus TaxID=71717 RepID=A0A4Y7TTS6_COPMI|nr:hypothetical protein FA13DRAFT_1682447 [Coprinellus micaceus]
MDIDTVQPAFQKKEFLAVLLAGFGNELLPLTSDNGDEPSPKALLPVANKPLLEYTLSWLEQSGIKDVLLIAPTIHESALHHHINSDTTASNLSIDLQTYDETHESSIGTAELLRHFAPRITEDFVLVPCDFIAPPSLPLSTLLDKYRLESTSHGAIVSTCWYPAYAPEKGILVDEWGQIPTSPALVWDPKTDSLLHVDTPDELDRNAEEYGLKMDMLSRYPRTRLSSSLQDSHVYVCHRKVLQLLAQKPRFESFRQDFIPWLCKIQYQPSKRRKYAEFISSIPNQTTYLSQSLALTHSTTPSAAAQSVATLVPLEESSTPTTTSPNSSLPPPTFKVTITIHKSEDGLALRINNLYALLEMNRVFLSAHAQSAQRVGGKATPAPQVQGGALVDPKAQISADTMLGGSTQVGERTVCKKSVIGRHCIIGRNVKIVGSILLDHCVVEDGAKLEGCILGKNTKVGSRSELARVVSCGGYEVGGGETLKGEKLDVSDWTAEVPHGNEDESTESGEENEEDDSD